MKTWSRFAHFFGCYISYDVKVGEPEQSENGYWLYDTQILATHYYIFGIKIRTVNNEEGIK